MTLLVLVVLGLAVYRATRLVVRDELTRPLRDRWLGPLFERGEHRYVEVRPGLHRGEEPPLRARLTAQLAYLASCPWCLSVWLSLGAVLLVVPWPGWRWLLLDVLAVAGIAGWLLDREQG